MGPDSAQKHVVRRSRRSQFFWALIALSVATLLLAIWAWRSRSAPPQAQTVEVSQSVAPDFSLQAADGSTVSLGDLRGKVVLLNFWATWCPPCKAEMPDLEALYRDHGIEHDFVVVGVNLQEDRDTVRKYAGEARISFPLLLDSTGEVSGDRYAVRTLPMSMIIGRDGRIRDAWSGRLSRETMVDRLERVW
jgi:peroxiredoxin